MINELPSNNTVHVFCDGSVCEGGRAGCGVLVRNYTDGTPSESEYSLRLSDHISSTQAELQAIKLALTKVATCNKDIYIFVDSRGALESLNSSKPIYQKLSIVCKNIIHSIKTSGSEVKLYWVPSHVGIRCNERVDMIAKKATEKCIIDIHCALSMRQVRSLIRVKQDEITSAERALTYERSATFRHYYDIDQETGLVYDKQGSLQDTVIMRLRLGYRYLWELGCETPDKERECRLCGENDSHTLTHYVLHCSLLTPYRNSNINNVTEQIIWLINNNKIEEILKKYKKFAPRV